MRKYNCSFVLRGCETWSLTLKEECRLRVFERVLRRMFGPKRHTLTWNGENYIMRSLYDIYIFLTQYFPDDKIEKNEVGGACSTYDGEKRCYTRFWWGNLQKRDHVEDPNINGNIILIWIFRKWEVRVWTGPIWLRKRTGGEHL